MTISWFGLSSFKITGRDVTIITDPFGKEAGLSPVRGNADIVIVTDPNNSLCNNISSVSGNPFVVKGPGEYDVKNVFMVGNKSGEKNKELSTIYAIHLEDIRIAFFGPVKIADLSDEQKEMLEGSDIVLIPVGNKDAMGHEEAAKISTKLEPYYVIPHSYKTPGSSLNLEKLDKFLKEMSSSPEELDKFTVKKKDFQKETTSLVILTPQR
jgi:L-ascorbate metabolism protein UlaG (beta-lactamase superfamily)